jgi:hypothetical protein
MVAGGASGGGGGGETGGMGAGAGAGGVGGVGGPGAGDSAACGDGIVSGNLAVVGGSIAGARRIRPVQSHAPVIVEADSNRGCSRRPFRPETLDAVPLCIVLLAVPGQRSAILHVKRIRDRNLTFLDRGWDCVGRV